MTASIGYLGFRPARVGLPPVFTESIQAARSSTLCPTGLVVLRSESPATQHGFSQPACAHVLPSATEPLLVAPQTPSRSRLRDPSSAPALAPASIRPIAAWQNAPVCCRRPQCSARARVTFSSLGPGPDSRHRQQLYTRAQRVGSRPALRAEVAPRTRSASTVSVWGHQWLGITTLCARA